MLCVLHVCVIICLSRNPMKHHETIIIYHQSVFVPTINIYQPDPTQLVHNSAVLRFQQQLCCQISFPGASACHGGLKMPQATKSMTLICVDL